MVVINNLFAAMPGAPIEVTHFVGHIINWIQGFIGNYGWTVVVFTVLLKLVMSPLDFWQKHSMYKNARIMKKVKPQMDKLQKQYANNKQMFQQKQLELYRKEGYSMFGGCLPMIITLVLFFVIFAGFNATTTYNASQEYYEIATTWETAYGEAYQQKKAELIDEITAAREQAMAGVEGEAQKEFAAINAERAIMDEFEAGFRAIADSAVLDSYQPTSWLWVGNVFQADGWSNKIPDYGTFTGTGLGNLGITKDKMMTTEEDYNKHTAALRNLYSGWNGYLILPLLTIVVTLASQILMKATNPQPMSADPSNPAANQTKMMQWMMPAMMGFFALFYSSIFTIYLLFSQLISLLTQAGFNLYAKAVDKKEEEHRLRTTFKH